MAQEQGYNGYTNYETWNAALWIDNDQYAQEFWQERAADLLEEHDEDKDAAVGALARELEAQFEENKDDVLSRAGMLSSMWADLLGRAVGQIDWHELALTRFEE